MGKHDQHLSSARREALKAGSGSSAWSSRSARVQAQGLKKSAAKSKQKDK